MSFSSLLNNEMNIVSSSMSVGTYGGQTPNLTTIYSAQPCRIQQLSMRERDFLSKQGTEATHKVFCEANLSIHAHYHIIVSGITYQVTGYDVIDGAALAHHQEVITRRVSV